MESTSATTEANVTETTTTGKTTTAVSSANDERQNNTTQSSATASSTAAPTSNVSSSSNTQNGYRPLNVKDALTYLDQVKVQFSEHPEVYNKFLDIMKDFKSQAIDTPGVIERVSTLFRGHPLLISGFNTFLPPGYCIECITDEHSHDIIKVTTPNGTTTTNAGEPLRLGSETTGNRRAPVEFNHAINYVNKIKNRFSSDPDIYKQFLEILQTYQKEQRPIQEVYGQVQVLFNGDSDLLAEFKQFLPDTTGRKKRATNMLTSGISKRSKLQNKMDTQTSDVRSGMSLDQDMVRPFVSGEEVEFFEQVKKYIGSKATYNAFLKVLNLFSQQIVDQNVLVNRVEGFIGGNKELFDMFKTLVGYDGKDEIVENVPADLDKPDLSTCRACGPSYRLIPKSWEQSQVCSGKDELCLEVLNDKYVSHPTWASEDSGYVTSKKNQYEEALHRVEEERYDYDLNIEANLNTIALLEPIMKKISAMTPEEKAEFTLPVGLGGPSKTIYQRIIKKIYGNDKGLQVIGLLHSSPAQTVPIVLKRLKQKDDEWKRAQREWNKIWREVEAKNYLKALDYQGITFKSKREISSSTTTTTTLLAPARKPPQFTFVFDQKSVLKDVMRLIYYFLDRTELYSAENQDKMRSFMETLLPLIFDVDKDGDEEAAADDDEAADEADDEEDEESRSIQSYDSDGDAIMATRRNGSSTTTATRSIKKNNGSNSKRSTLKDILTRNISSTHTSGQQQQQQEQPETDVDVPEANNNDVKTDESQETTKEEIPTNNEKEDQQRALPKEQTPTTTTTTTTTGDTSHKRHVYNLFADSEFYCFFRLYQLIYERLCQMKSLDEEYKKDPIKTKRENKAALNLGLKSKAISDFHLKFNKGYYQALLTLIEKFFEGDIDQSLFEESSRYIFGSKAYVLFTIDKVMLALIRHTHLIISNDKSPLLLDLFKQDHSLEHVDAQILGDYRLRVEDIVGKEEVLFNIAFDTIRRTLSIQILSGDDEDYEKNSRDDYEEYVSNYIDWANATKGINTSDLTPRFLKSDEADDVRQDIFVRSGMQYKICRDTYHMFYIIGTEDIFIRLPTKPRPTQQQQQQESSAKWTSWLESNWSKGISDKEQAEKDARQLLFSN
ncbi:uncharacterized protein BX664DRAFT_268933 [Halteromyces radiatus]|uniref:uncharacterized protein n=1 Tax=Halteromyces radiatus TaxID=101107 RepID=UPI0022203647|nr:uncharacterized protein BX664DRAFT_268933 [Halteromyces radiatus]KAI8081365.1 hypothetical protein BX664DRAFT_268933 [Halteromyces radiatus]